MDATKNGRFFRWCAEKLLTFLLWWFCPPPLEKILRAPMAVVTILLFTEAPYCNRERRRMRTDKETADSRDYPSPASVPVHSATSVTTRPSSSTASIAKQKYPASEWTDVQPTSVPHRTESVRPAIRPHGGEQKTLKGENISWIDLKIRTKYVCAFSPHYISR